VAARRLILPLSRAKAVSSDRPPAVTRREEREKFLADITETLKQELEKSGIKAEVTGRPKHIYSIYDKIKRYEAQGRDFGDIHDLLAVRILVDTVSDCYQALGVIHNLCTPSRRINDL